MNACFAENKFIEYYKEKSAAKNPPAQAKAGGILFPMTNKNLLKDSLGWGFVLWLIGYGLGMILFSVVPISLIGWIILPIGTTITLWVLFKKIKGDTFQYYVLLAFVWVIIAIIFDYFFIVKLLKPADFYYKTDVYLYYSLTFLLPLFAGWHKRSFAKK